MNVFKLQIDPIDATLFEPILDSNVDHFYQKHYALVYPLNFLNKVPDHRKQSQIPESPHVLPLAPAVPRFPLLPIGGTLQSSLQKSRSNVTLDQLGQTFNAINRRKHSDAKQYPKPIVKFHLEPTADGLSTKPLLPESVLGLVNSGQAREKATELFMNASNFLSGVLNMPQTSPTPPTQRK